MLVWSVASSISQQVGFKNSANMVPALSQTSMGWHLMWRKPGLYFAKVNLGDCFAW